MVTSRQKSDIQMLMRRIKDAKDDGKDNAEIKRRTRELHQYLIAEGLVQP